MKTQVWAHRGASAYAPENTMAAFEMAEKMGADGFELDVQFTKDGQLVVCHDESIDRTSNGTGWVKDYTYEELLKFNFNMNHPDYEYAKIPLLSEVLEFLKTNSMMLNIELKNGYFLYPGMEEKTYALVEEMGVQDRVIYSTFNHRSIAKMKAMHPDIHAGILCYDIWADSLPDYTKKLGVDAIHPGDFHVWMDENLIKDSHTNGVKVHIWTVNEEKDMLDFTRKGADAIITNYPDIARKVVDSVK